MFSLLLSVSLLLLAFTAATHALLTKSDSRSALAWVSFCLLMPLVGPAAYLLFGINRTRSTAARLYASPQLSRAELEAQYSRAGHTRALIGQRASGRSLRGCQNLRFLVNGDECFPAMLDDIHQARDSIYLCTYLFQHDQIGRQFVAALEAAQARGVEVCILIDGLGELAYPPRVGSHLLRAGLRFARFDPLRLIPPSLHINLRNHRKTLIIDRRIAYTGGHNISARHLVDDPAVRSPARDLHVRVEGSIVADFGRAFADDWQRSSGESLHARWPAETETPPDSDIHARLILDGPNEDLDKLNDVLLGVFSSAQDRLWLMTPYFLPDRDLVGALTAARLRGVDVRVILPERGNVHLAHWAAQHTLRRLVGDGLPVYLLPAPFIHTKAILIDQDYALLGSANIDPRSLRLNFELGLELFSHSCNAWLGAYIDDLFVHARKLDPQAPDPRARWMRLRDAIAWLFSPFL